MILRGILLFCIMLHLTSGHQSIKSPNIEHSSRRQENLQTDLLYLFDNIENQLCRKHCIEIINGFNNFEAWAIQMVDASAKLQSGLLKGNIKNMGNYDECVDTRGSTFSGQYCLTNVHVTPLPGVSHYAATARVINIITLGRLDREITINRTNIPVPDILPSMSMIQMGVCVPSSCSPRDIELLMNFAMQELARPAGLQTSVDISEGACSILHSKPWTLGELAFIYIMLFILLLVALGTAFDVLCPESNNQTISRRILATFSLPTNCMKMVAMGPSPPGSFSSLDGIRVFSTIWVVLGHKVTTYLQEPWVNKVLIVEIMSMLKYTPVINNMVSVDSFFLISGLLKSINFLKELEHNKFDFFKCLARRYLRLTPVYALVIMFYATLMPRLSNGPTWHRSVELPSSACSSNWALNLLYLNNYINPDKLCMIQTWYLAADMQLHLLAPLLLYPIWRWPQRAFKLLGIFVVTSTLIPFLYIYITKALPIFVIGAEDTQLIHYFRGVHIATHNRAAPFVMGLALGYIIFKYGSLKLSKITVVCCWTACFVILYLALYGSFDVIQYNHKYNALDAAIYGALHRPSWALAVAWIIFACHTGYGGWINGLLSAPLFQPLSRISYCIYLTHYVVLMVGIGRMRTAIFVGPYDLTHAVIGDLAIAGLIAIFLHLTVEAPMFEITKMFFNRGKFMHKPASKVSDTKNHELENEMNLIKEKTAAKEKLMPLISELDEMSLKAKQR